MISFQWLKLTTRQASVEAPLIKNFRISGHKLIVALYCEGVSGTEGLVDRLIAFHWDSNRFGRCARSPLPAGVPCPPFCVKKPTSE